MNSEAFWTMLTLNFIRVRRRNAQCWWLDWSCLFHLLRLLLGL